MSNQPPAPRPCSHCNKMLYPQMHGTSIDSNFNTVKHYDFGHNCPELQRQYNRDIDRINESNMNPEQKRNAIDLAGYQNMWGR